MGNQVNQYCTSCNYCNSSDNQAIKPQTRFIEVQGNFKHPIRTKKFYISSDSLVAHKISQFIIFTDESLNMLIPNEPLGLDGEQVQKLEQVLRCQLKNKSLIVKQDYFVLKSIEQQSDDQFAQLKQLPQPSVQSGSNIEKEKKKAQNELLQQKIKQRAFKFRNPLRKYNIASIIVVLLPIYKSQSDLRIIKEGLQQAFSLADDSKSIGIGQISYMLGYQSITFQKLVIQYMLCMSKLSIKQYYFKRFSECIYLTHDFQYLEMFFKLLNIYIDSIKIQKKLSNQTLVTQPSSSSKFKKLGPHYSPINLISKAKNTLVASQSIIQDPNVLLLTQLERQKALSKISSQKDEQIYSVNDFSQILSSDDSKLKGIKLRSLKSKGSSVSDYF